MRYLWVEDFDGGKSGQKEIKHSLEKYFELENKNINIQTLEGALRFLDIPDNWKLFDAVLIDIRFKISEVEGGEKEIYEKYFSSFLTEEKYLMYTYKINGDVNSASSGVLLYLALIHKYNFNQDRIAFISANVDESSEQLADIDAMREIIYKDKYCKLDDSDKAKFSLLNEEIFDLYCELYCISDEDKEAEKYFAIPKTSDIKWNNLDDLERRINIVADQIKEKLHENHGSNDSEKNLKYNSLKEEFEKVGLKLPAAFEKPVDNSESISWRFKKWVDELLQVDYYKLRANILPVCIDSLDKLSHNNSSDFNYHNLCMKYNSNDIRSDKEKTEKIICLLEQIIDAFPENILEERCASVYTGIIRQCVSLCDEIKLDKIEKRMIGTESALKSVLVIVRNWISHQGINNKSIASYDVAFIFYALTYVFLSDEYLANEVELLLSLDNDTIEEKENINLKINKMIGIAEKRHCDAYNRYKDRVGNNKGKYYYNENACIHEIISSIGNEYSDLRENVNMEYIYLLYLGKLAENEYNTLERKLVKRLLEGEFSS